MFLSKRKAFDSKAARLEGTEAEKVKPKKEAKPAKKNAWEAKSSALRDAMKAARMYKKAVESGMYVELGLWPWDATIPPGT